MEKCIVIKVVSINVVIATASLLVLEILCGFLFYAKNGHLVYGRERNFIVFSNEHLSKHFTPNVNLRLARWPNYPSDLKINDNGLVDTTNKENIINNNIIVVIGGSTVEGRGASSNSTTIPSFLSSCLSERDSSYRVLNLGRAGLYSYTEFRLLTETFLSKFQPKIVIQLNGRNDFHYSLNNNASEFFPHSDVKNYAEISYMDTHGVSFRQFLMDLIGDTHIFRAFKALSIKYGDNANNGTVYEMVDLPSSSKMYLRSLKAAQFLKSQTIATKAISDFWGAEYFHFLQPALSSGLKSLSNDEEQSINEWMLKTNLGSKYFQELETFYDNAIAVLGDQTTDLSSLFKKNGEQNLYVDTVHYNDLGNKLLGYEICKTVLNGKKYEPD